MLRMLVMVVAVVLLAGCGGGDGGDGEVVSTPTPTPTPTPESTRGGGDAVAGSPLETFREFLAAAGDGDADAMWARMSASAREQFGPTQEEFAAGSASAFAEGAGAWSDAGYDVVVDERMGDTAIVAIAGERTAEGQTAYDAYAVPMRVEGDEWKVALGGDLRLQEFRPPPPHDGVGRRPRVAASFESPTAVEEARLWIDGREIDPATERDGELTTVSARPAQALGPGGHSVVVFVAAGGDVAAVAWAFTAGTAP